MPEDLRYTGHTADPRACEACEACGLISVTAEYIRVRTTNGGLHLCRQCLGDINRKNPELAELRDLLAECQEYGLHRCGSIAPPCLGCRVRAALATREPQQEPTCPK